MDCHMDLIATSNREAAVFIDKDDRRTEMIKINPELKTKLGDKASTKFWEDLNDEFDNVEIMAAWFSFLAHRDIAGVVFNEDYRFSKEDLQVCALNNLINSYQFMTVFFVRSDCVLNNSRLLNIAPDFFSYTEFKIHRGERTMFIKAQKLYKILYKDIWCVDSGNKIQKKERTFTKDLDVLGLKCRYKLHNGTQTSTVIRFSRKTLIQGLVDTHTHISSHKLEGFFMDINSIWEKLIKHQFEYGFTVPT